MLAVPTRNQLSEFLSNSRTLKAFEGLFDNATGSKGFGIFSDTTNQGIVAVNTPVVILFDTTNLLNKIELNSGLTQIKVNAAGVYNLQYTIQLKEV